MATTGNLLEEIQGKVLEEMKNARNRIPEVKAKMLLDFKEDLQSGILSAIRDTLENTFIILNAKGIKIKFETIEQYLNMDRIADSDYYTIIKGTISLIGAISSNKHQIEVLTMKNLDIVDEDGRITKEYVKAISDDLFFYIQDYYKVGPITLKDIFGGSYELKVYFPENLPENIID